MRAARVLAEEFGGGRVAGLEVEAKGQEMKVEDSSMVYKVSDFICGVERGWILLLITTAWWACSARGTWRLPGGRVS